MNKAQEVFAVASLAVASFSTAAAADNADTVQAFYDLLSNPDSESHAAAFGDATSETWESVGDYSDENKSRDAFLG